MSDTPQPPQVSKIDGVNYVRRKVPTASGTLELEGLTVRALIASLQACDPDDLVCYMAEVLPEHRTAGLIIGVIAGMAGGSECGTVFMFGPEGIRGLKNGGVI